MSEDFEKEVTCNEIATNYNNRLYYSFWYIGIWVMIHEREKKRKTVLLLLQQ